MLLQSPATLLRKHEGDRSVYIRPFVTSTSELIGAIVVFGEDPTVPATSTDVELDEVCWMATLALSRSIWLRNSLIERTTIRSLTLEQAWMEEEIDCVVAAERPGTAGLAILGIDHFRLINDVLGHHIGNKLLCQVAQRVYQPQIDLRTGELRGVEALTRWNHPALASFH